MVELFYLSFYGMFNIKMNVVLLGWPDSWQMAASVELLNEESKAGKKAKDLFEWRTDWHVNAQYSWVCLDLTPLCAY